MKARPRSSRPSTKNQLFVLLALCGLNFFTSNQYLYPNIMEARNLITAREMLQKDNWLSPTMNDYPRLAKPPLPTWCNAAIGKVAGLDSMVINRVPGAIMGTLLVLCVWWFARIMYDDDPVVPLVAGSVAATSVYVLYMARQATWDIYCHAFMLAAIALLATCWRAPRESLRRYAAAGVLLGLSFLSKGPIAFYALLLPFLISWGIFEGGFRARRDWRGLALCTVIAVALSAIWPVYTLLTNADAFLQTIGTETNSWSNRHVRPWYHYWNFPIQAGVWAFVIFAALVYPYARRRVAGRHYRFALGWTVAAVVLLSIPAEKKERYLLPVLIPTALLAAQYLVGLYRAAQAGTLERTDRIVIRGNAYLFAAAAAAAPVVFYAFGLRSGWLVLAFVLFWGVAALLIRSVLVLRLSHVFLGMCALMTAVSLVTFPALRSVYYVNDNFTPLRQLETRPYYAKPFYGSNVNPEQVWDLGKSVDTLRLEDSLILFPPEDRFVILARDSLDARSFVSPPTSCILRDALFYDPRKADRCYYVYEVAR